MLNDKNEGKEATKGIDRIIQEWEENRVGSHEAIELLIPDLKTIVSYFEIIQDVINPTRKMRTLLTVEEAAKFLHIHPMSLRRLVSKRKIPFIKREGIGIKFNIEKLEAWVREGEIEPSK